jgi:hypothetical protein
MGVGVSGIVGFVFIVTMLNCVFGALDQLWQQIKRKWKARKQ